MKFRDLLLENWYPPYALYVVGSDTEMPITTDVGGVHIQFAKDEKISSEETEQTLNKMGPNDPSSAIINGDIIESNGTGDATDNVIKGKDLQIMTKLTNGCSEGSFESVGAVNCLSENTEHKVNGLDDGGKTSEDVLATGESVAVKASSIETVPHSPNTQDEEIDELLLLCENSITETGITVSPSEDKVLDSGDEEMAADSPKMSKSKSDHENDQKIDVDLENEENLADKDGDVTQNDEVMGADDEVMNGNDTDRIIEKTSESKLLQIESKFEASGKLTESCANNGLSESNKMTHCTDDSMNDGDENVNTDLPGSVNDKGVDNIQLSDSIENNRDVVEAGNSDTKIDADDASVVGVDDSQKSPDEIYERTIGDEINAIVNGSKDENASLNNPGEQDVLEVEIDAESEYNIIEFDDTKLDCDSVDENVLKSPPQSSDDTESSFPKSTKVTEDENLILDEGDDENSAMFSSKDSSLSSSCKSKSSSGALQIGKSFRDSFKCVVENALNHLSQSSGDDSQVEKLAPDKASNEPVVSDVRVASTTTTATSRNSGNLFENMSSALVTSAEHSVVKEDVVEDTVDAADNKNEDESIIELNQSETLSTSKTDNSILILENSDEEEVKDDTGNKEVGDDENIGTNKDCNQITDASQSDAVRKRVASPEANEPEAKRMKVPPPDVNDANSQPMSDFSSSTESVPVSDGYEAMDTSTGTSVSNDARTNNGTDSGDKPQNKKDFEAFMQAKFSLYLTKQMEKIIAPLRKRVQELKVSNEAWKATAIELRKKVEEAEVLINQNELQSKTNRRVSTRSIGLQVDNSKVAKMQQAAFAASTVIGHNRPVTPRKSPPTTTIPIRPNLMPANTTLTTSSNTMSQLVRQMQFVPSPATPPSVTNFAKQNQHQIIKPAGKAMMPATLPAVITSTGQRVVNANVVNSTIAQQINVATSGTIMTTNPRDVQLFPNSITVPVSAVRQNGPRFTSGVIGQPRLAVPAPTTLTTTTRPPSLQVIDLTGDDSLKKKPTGSVNIVRGPAPPQLVTGNIQGVMQQVRPLQQLPAGTGILVNNQGQAVYLRQNSAVPNTTPTIIYQAPAVSTSSRPPIVTLLQQPPAGSNVRSTIVQVPASSPLLQQASFPQTANVMKSPAVMPRQQITPALPAAPKQTAVQLPSSSSITVTPPPPKPVTVQTNTTKPTPIAVEHPAPLPLQPQSTLKNGKSVPPKPGLKISRVTQGIVLSWNMQVSLNHEEISRYQLYAYQESSAPPSTSLWKRVGDVKALPLPMACTLTQFQEGNRYHFAVRAIDSKNRVGPFSDPSSIHLQPSTSSS
ncbi:uncharacterized protein LOC141903201 [Tubulanus polymorphus]|uniref:uncharacterized protein LOC141903201 n=1 Tax=Tubulanus polymorphus TaxID=672921 RepID=UPI003DA25278